MSENVRELSAENWDAEVLEAELPVLVDFWAPWCPPCRALAPIVAQVAGEVAGRVRVAKLNIDQEGSLAERYDVRSIPTLLLFRDGQVVERRVGAMPKRDLIRFLDSHPVDAESYRVDDVPQRLI